MAHIVVVDAHTFSLRLIKRAAVLGHRVTYVSQSNFQWYQDTEESRSAIGFADQVFALPALTLEDDLAKLLASIDADHRVDAVICVVDPSIEATSRVCARLSIPFTDATAVSNARRKYLARGLTANAGLASPKFGFAANMNEFPSVLQKLTYPVVIKPASGFSGFLCQLALNRRQAIHAARAIDQSAAVVPAALREQFSRGIMVEEVLKGTLYPRKLGCSNSAFTASRSRGGTCLTLVGISILEE